MEMVTPQIQDIKQKTLNTSNMQKKKNYKKTHHNHMA